MKISFFLCALGVAMNASAADSRIMMEEFMVPAADAGIQLYVRNKHPEGVSRFAGDKILLYVHGATYPASTAFDLKLDGLSWMEYIAQRGYDVYLLDLRGYGKSTRPKEMSEDAGKNPPLVRNDTAIRDIATVVDFVRARRN